jgi:hypothetical protein
MEVRRARERVGLLVCVRARMATRYGFFMTHLRSPGGAVLCDQDEAEIDLDHIDGDHGDEQP